MLPVRSRHLPPGLLLGVLLAARPQPSSTVGSLPIAGGLVPNPFKPGSESDRRMASQGSTAESRGNYTGWLLGLLIIAAVALVAALAWIHYHG